MALLKAKWDASKSSKDTDESQPTSQFPNTQPFNFNEN